MSDPAGEVFEATHHGSAVAIKVLEISDDRTMLDACHEFGFLHGLRHSKLVVSYGACVDVSCQPNNRKSHQLLMCHPDNPQQPVSMAEPCQSDLT